jgi:hypothetical protein
MEQTDARALLGISGGASDTEIEAAYRKGVNKVRKHYEKARDRSTRTQCEREFDALKEARSALLPETDDATIEPVSPVLERVSPALEPVTPAIERVSPALEPDTPALEPVILALEPVSPIEPVSPAIEPVSPAIERVSPAIERVSPAIERVSPAIERVSPAIEFVPPPIEAVAPPVRLLSTPIEPVAAPHERRRSVALILLQRNAWLAVAGIIFILASISAFVFLPRPSPDGSKLGKLVLNTVPDHAKVFLDGVSRGTTPLVLESVAPGDRQLRIESEGYETEQLIILIKPGDERFFPLVTLVPKKESVFTVTPAPSSPAVTSALSVYPGEKYPQTRKRFLTEADVADLDFAELQYAINEMYARHGAPFLKEPDIESQFRTFEWYHPIRERTLAQIEAEFSVIENQNRDFLAGWRDQKCPK